MVALRRNLDNSKSRPLLPQRAPLVCRRWGTCNRGAIYYRFGKIDNLYIIGLAKSTIYQQGSREMSTVAGLRLRFSEAKPGPTALEPDYSVRDSLLRAPRS